MSPLLMIVLAALRMPGPLSTRPASYVIDARLDGNDVKGTSTLTWRNDASGPAEALVFHLYMNAFKNEQSAFFAEGERDPAPRVAKGKWGSIDVTAVHVRRGGSPTEAHLIVPPTGDQTLATLPLDRPVAPGETIEVTMAFSTHLPDIVARAGETNGFYAVAQWFPKIGVFECDPACRFRASTYHPDSEFFADFGRYDVALDVPSDLVIGSTGVLVREDVVGDRRHATYHADDVHDFAWSADARFVKHELDVVDDPKLPPVHVVLLGAADVARHASRHLEAARATLVELGRRLGPYPYSQLTIVQPPSDASAASGMEYPTFFFTADRPELASMHELELTTVHELAHQWFQGMVASDEVEEPWLDEGLTEAATGWGLDTLGPLYRIAGHEATYAGMERALLDGQRSDPIARSSYGFRDTHAYAQSVYRKTSLLLATLQERLGAQAFERDLRAYVDRSRFRHPRGADLVAAFADASPALRALLDDAVSSAGAVDYAVTHVQTLEERPAAGLFDGPDGRHELAPTKTDRWHSEVVMERFGEHRLPVTLRARFADGTTIDRTWTPADPDVRWKRETFDSASRLVDAELAPTPLDVHRWNDGLRTEPDRAPRSTIVRSLELLLSFSLSWLGR